MSSNIPNWFRDMSPNPRLLDQVREAIRVRHYSYRTEQQYVAWILQYIRFHDRKHPRDLGGPEVERFLSHLATERRVAAATQAQALAAVLFLYKHVLNVNLPWLGNVVRATRPKRLPLVLSRLEVRRVLSELSAHFLLIASLLYGSGLRVLEALRLRQGCRHRAQNHPCTRWQGRKGSSDGPARRFVRSAAPAIEVGARTPRRRQGARLCGCRASIFPRAKVSTGTSGNGLAVPVPGGGPFP